MADRTPISAANWKMHLTNDEAISLCQALGGIEDIPGVEVVIAPGFLQLEPVWHNTDRRIQIAGQNMHHAEEGAFTGEVSPAQLAELATWVILGHSERRRLFCEDEVSLQAKLGAAKEAGLTPILCVGESWTEREEGRAQAVLNRQLGILDADAPEDLVIAYEPVWAIGSGRAATAEEAGAAAAFIRERLAGAFGGGRAEATRVLYGGSVNAENAGEFAAQEGVDGALIGGASLDAASFMAITQAIATA